MALQAVGYILLAGVMFGSVSVISRFMLGQFNPISYVSTRFLLSALVILAFYVFKIKGRTWPKSKTLIIRSVLYGVIVDTLEVVLYIAALQYISAGLAATLNSVFPVVTVILAFIFLPNEHITWKTGLGVMLGLAGVILIISLGETGLTFSGETRMIGYLLLAGSGLVYSVGGIYARKYMTEFDTFDVVAFRIFGAAAVTTLMKFALDPHGIHQVTQTGAALIIFSALIYVVGFQLQFYILKRFGVSNQAMVSYILPIVSSILGVLFLSEIITAGMAVGMGFIIAGLMVVNSRRKAAVSP
ncbi:MAG: DMT family transporter [Anaerolineaceae bacterium]